MQQYISSAEENKNIHSQSNCNNCNGNGTTINGLDAGEGLLKSNLCEINFKRDRFNYYTNYQNLILKISDTVIVEAERGCDLGVVTAIGDCAIIKYQAKKNQCHDFKKILRSATEEDLNLFKANRQKEEDAFDVAIDKIRKYNLSMKLVDVEYQLDSSRITFYYTADHRIDFRELVKDLAHIYHTRIEMRQIGVRDETKRIGGVGVCGREICCTTWLFDFERISSQYVSVQGLTFNPIKLSGQCGRLKCCLLFELDNYG
ncbi:MAG: regulatory iron-sulfur-containing complex subunit RicT [Bacteroidota bacterium]|nr:regulatory iron-sulfur-containing complex subunit RicT [Bacteroidota bacterium]